MKIGVLGAGTMGAGIAQLFAQAGYEVVIRDLKDSYLQKGLTTVNKSLSRLVKKEKLTEEEKTVILSRISVSTEISSLKEVDLIIEAAVENMDIKKKIFAELDEVVQSSAIFATNTSSLSITEIAASTSRPSQVIGMHFFNPVPMMKLVEVISGIATSDRNKKQYHRVIKDYR